jgi:hypothetical protein
MNANLYVIEDYENETAFRPKKANPNKPNFLNAEMNESLLATKDYENETAWMVISFGGSPTMVFCEQLKNS